MIQDQICQEWQVQPVNNSNPVFSALLANSIRMSPLKTKQNNSRNLSLPCTWKTTMKCIKKCKPFVHNVLESILEVKLKIHNNTDLDLQLQIKYKWSMMAYRILNNWILVKFNYQTKKARCRTNSHLIIRSSQVLFRPWIK